ncbi:MAG: restriction endonuclease subunit S, partial [Thermoplasmata archaeon]|nr:restriction endonuclease subunit S [Thermoplasmata archaeon]
TVDDAIQKTDEIVVKSRHLKMGLMRQLLTKGIGHTKFKKTEIGEMPDEWEAAELGEIGRTVTGRTPPTEVSEYYGGPYMFISPADIGEEKFVRESQKWLSKRGLDVSRPVGRNTILVVCIGATIGKTAMTQAESSATNQQINAVVPKDDVDPHYLYYAISHRSPRLAIQAGHAAVPIVNKGFFEQFLVPIPPISEQQKIAAVLSIVDADIDEETKRKTHLRELKKGLMQVLLTGKVRVKVT